jgi:hypothetical protein
MGVRKHRKTVNYDYCFTVRQAKVKNSLRNGVV